MKLETNMYHYRPVLTVRKIAENSIGYLLRVSIYDGWPAQMMMKYKTRSCQHQLLDDYSRLEMGDEIFTFESFINFMNFFNKFHEFF